MVLTGSEVKNIDAGKVSLVDSFCYFNGNELFVKNMVVSHSNKFFEHDTNRDKKLLMKKKELRKLKKDLVNGLTIVPYKIFRNSGGLFKMEIVLAKGKKLHDKRDSIKTRDIERELNRML